MRGDGVEERVVVLEVGEWEGDGYEGGFGGMGGVDDV